MTPNTNKNTDSVDIPTVDNNQPMTFVQEQVERLCRNDNHISGNSGDSNKYAIKKSSIVRLINQSISEGKRMEMDTQRVLNRIEYKVLELKRRSDSSTYLYGQGESHAYGEVLKLLTPTPTNSKEV